MKKLVVVFVLVLSLASPGIAANVDTMGIGAKATALGGAYSAYADDPYAVYYNPAGLTQISTPVVSGGLFAMKPTLRYDDLTVDQDNTTILGPQSYTERFDPLYVPHLGAAYPISKCLVFGIALYAPYGLDLEWSDNPVENPGAYSAFHTLYARAVITPALGYQINDTLSVGAGISLGRSEMVAEKVLFGSELMLGSQTQITLDMMDDLNYSFNVGLMYHPEDCLFLGITYRSKADAVFEGAVELNGIDTGIDVRSHFDHPEQLQGGFRYITPHNVSLSMDLTWTRWSIQGDQVGVFSAPLLGLFPEARYERDWNDTIQLRMGAEWHVSDMLDLRAGYFYDPSPITDGTFDFGWPDADRQTYSLGSGVHLGNWTIDSVIQYFTAESDREIGGESSNLNESFQDLNPATTELASIKADGFMWAAGMTVSYKFP